MIDLLKARVTLTYHLKLISTLLLIEAYVALLHIQQHPVLAVLHLLTIQGLIHDKFQLVHATTSPDSIGLFERRCHPRGKEWNHQRPSSIAEIPGMLPLLRFVASTFEG